MLKTKPWREVWETRSKLTPAQRAQIEADARREIEQMNERMRLPEMRKARKLSQEALADSLGIAQGDVSKIERRADVYLSTLRRYVEAAGGQLQLIARFPDAEPIEIEMIGNLEAPTEEERAESLKEWGEDQKRARERRVAVKA